MRNGLLLLAAVAGFLALPKLAEGQASSAEIAAAVRSFAETGDARVIRGANSISFPYGQVRPILTCAPLRTCSIVLGADEEYLAHVAGDTERWFFQETLGPGGVSLIVAKPFECDVTTDLTITTTRRIYTMVADSPPCTGADVRENPDLPWTPLVMFYYPHDLITESAQAQERLARAAAASNPVEIAPGVTRSAASTVEIGARNADMAALHFGYRWQRDTRYPWVPSQVYDDGARTFIRLPSSARTYEQPLLFELAPDGSMQMVNYLVTPMDSGDVYTVDRVLHRGVLVVGNDSRRQAQRLLIVREGG